MGFHVQTWATLPERLIRVPAVREQAPGVPGTTMGSPETLGDQRGEERPRHCPSSLNPTLLTQPPLEEDTLISQALMRQNGTDLVRHWGGGGAAVRVRR